MYGKYALLLAVVVLLSVSCDCARKKSRRMILREKETNAINFIR